jgi:hypothetical protein
MSGHSSAGRSHCQNCGEPLTGPFCATCGQHDIDYHRSVGPIIEDSLEGFLHFDGKFFKSVRWLFTRPGFLTKEFIAGRRVSYIHPLRLYIFASFLYFAANLFIPHPPAKVTLTDERGAKQGQVDLSAPAHSSRATAGVYHLVDRMRSEDPGDVDKELAHLMPTMLFFCLPFLATALLLAYAKSGRVYVEHLIFALHVQAFYFLAALATELVQAALLPFSPKAAGLAEFLAFLGGAALIYCAFLKVYGQGYWKTFFKLCLVGLLYGIVLILAVALTAVTASLLVLSSSPAAVPLAH